MTDQFSGGPLQPRRQFLIGRPLLQRPANHTIFILADIHTNYDRVGMVLCDHFGKTRYGAMQFIDLLSEQGHVQVATYSHDVAHTKLLEITNSRYGRRLGFQFDVIPPLKPPAGPVFG